MENEPCGLRSSAGVRGWGVLNRWVRSVTLRRYNNPNCVS